MRGKSSGVCRPPGALAITGLLLSTAILVVALWWLAVASRARPDAAAPDTSLYALRHEPPSKCYDCAAGPDEAPPSQQHWNVSHGAPQLHVGM